MRPHQDPNRSDTDSTGDRSDFFSRGPSDSLIPQLDRVPETPEEKRRRLIIRVVSAVVAVLLLITAVLIFLEVRHTMQVRDAALAATDTGRLTPLEEALALLEGEDGAEERALRARLQALALLEHGAERREALEALLEGLEGEAAARLDARVARTYLALARGAPTEAAEEVAGLTFSGTYASEGAHAAARAGLAVGDLQHAASNAAIAVEQRPEATRHIVLVALIRARLGDVDRALELLEQAGDSPAVSLARARILLDNRGGDDRAARAGALAQAALDAAEATAVERAYAHAVRARVASLAHDRDTVRSEVEAAREVRPPGDEAFSLLLAEALLDARLPDEAAAEMEQLPEEVSTDPGRRAQALAALALARGDYEGAKAALESAPEGPRTALLKGRHAAGRGRTDEARRLLRQATEAPAHALEAWIHLAAAEIEAEEAEAGLEAAREALTLTPHDPEAVPVAVAAHIALEQADQGVQLAEAALRVHENDPRLLAAKAEALMALERWEPALETLRSATELRPESSELHARLGEAARRVGRAEEARGAYEKALELSPRQPMALRGLLQLAVAARDVPWAKERLAAVDEAGLVSNAIDRARARYFILTGAGHEAVDEVRRSIIRRGRGDSLLWTALGRLQYQSEVFDGAARSFARALALDDEDGPEALIGLGMSQTRMRSTAPAERTLEEAAAAVPEDAEPWLKALLATAQARLAFETDRYAVAQRDARRALELAPRMGEAHMVLADVTEERNGDPTEHLEAAAEGVPPASMAVARMALRQEDTDEGCTLARQYWDMAPRGRYERRIRQMVLDCRRR